jgi:hypothetical protein
MSDTESWFQRHFEHNEQVLALLGSIAADVKTLLQRIPVPMSDALATALAPLDTAIAQNSTDIQQISTLAINTGSIVATEFTALQGSIAALTSAAAAGQTIAPADLADISNQVANLGSAHATNLTVIAALGSLANAGTVASTGSVVSTGT